MSINIKTSAENKDRVADLTRALPGSGNPENIIARIALVYSLCKKNARKFELSDDSSRETDSKGKEYKDDTFFGREGYREFYLAIVRMHYGSDLPEEKLQSLIKLHVDDGIEALHKIYKEGGRDNFIAEIWESVSDGLDFLPSTETFSGGKTRPPRPGPDGCTGAIGIEIGNDLSKGAPILLRINDEQVCLNSHIAFAGQSGSGKTQSAFEFLAQIHEKSARKTKFMFLDFKGSKKDDIAKFLQTTDAEFISPIDEIPFPLNPLAMIDATNSSALSRGIRIFSDIVCDCCSCRLGAVQRSDLIESLKEAFDPVSKTGKKPTLNQLLKILEERYETDGKKSGDSLMAILRGLTESSFFSDAEGEEFLRKNLYVSLGGNIPRDARFTALFVIVYYVYVAFEGMKEASMNGDIRSLRYVVFVDEAQNVFKNKNLSEKLEVMLRQLRSRGVSVCLAAQDVKSFFTKDFDFSSQCGTSVLLKVNDLNWRDISKFLGTTDATLARAKRQFDRGEKGVALVKSGNGDNAPVPAGTLAKLKFFHSRFSK